MSYLKPILAFLILWPLTLLCTAMALDALEWEQTGECRDCLILPHVADRFTETTGLRRYD